MAEVVRRIREEGLDKAEEYVKSQAKAYYGAVKLLVSGGRGILRLRV
ncbi:hypothetical protein [Vulcanisaeta distributa]|nr:hypothetical protein [Vulcanisaeta distributa]